MTRPLSIIGAQSSAGTYAPGQENAPAVWRRNGLMKTLASAGCSILDRGDTPSFRWRPDPDQPKAMNLDAVRDTARAVAHHSRIAFTDGHDLLVLGGDCSIELGVVAAANDVFASVGLIYVDLETDLNPPDDSDGALDWTGVAHLLDITGAAGELAGISAVRPLLGAQEILFFAAGNITGNERRTIEENSIPYIELDAVKSDPSSAARRAADWSRRFDAVLIHLDIDVLDFADFPIAENTRRGIGLTFDELEALLRPLCGLANGRALTITEINPDHAPDEAETFGRLNAMLAACLSQPAR